MYDNEQRSGCCDDLVESVDRKMISMQQNGCCDDLVESVDRMKISTNLPLSKDFVNKIRYFCVCFAVLKWVPDSGTH